MKPRSLPAASERLAIWGQRPVARRWLAVHHRIVAKALFKPREGGVKIVFDLPEAATDDAVRSIAVAGFEVRRYYAPEDEHRRGGSSPGRIRLGAERAMTEFTDAEQDAIVAEFDLACAASAIDCDRQGIDVWTAGGGDGSAGVREPRRPLPSELGGAAEVSVTRS